MAGVKDELERTVVGKTAGFLAAIAVLCLGQFAGAAQAGDTNFLKAGSPVEARAR